SCPPVSNYDPVRAKGSERRLIVADEQDCPPLLRNFRNLAETFPLEFDIPYGQHFVDHQYLRLKMRCYRERETEIHPAAITFDRRIDEAFQARESNDFIELSSNFSSRHAEDRAIQDDVLAPG